MSFTAYLQQKGYSPKTVACYLYNINRLLSWLESEGISSEQFSYNDLLDFMRYLEREGATKRTVHQLLGIIRHYGAYLTSEGKRTDNPAAGVFIRGLVRKLPVNLLSMEVLEELYNQYRLQLYVASSRKILFSLLVYQGLTAGELGRLQCHHLRLKDGKIFIKGTKRTNERVLELKAVQVTALQNYLVQNEITAGLVFTNRLQQHVSERNIHNRLTYLFEQLKQLNEQVLNAQQIRNSVITHWLRCNDVRQVQYMAGHKHVSSTERYQVTRLEDLAKVLEQHHPMR